MESYEGKGCLYYKGLINDKIYYHSNINYYLVNDYIISIHKPGGGVDNVNVEIYLKNGTKVKTIHSIYGFQIEDYYGFPPTIYDNKLHYLSFKYANKVIDSDVLIYKTIDLNDTELSEKSIYKLTDIIISFETFFD